jgi:predicted GIY-YIG superfamily endonuclease
MVFLYLIKNIDNSTYKIGVSKNPSTRIKQLQTGNASKLEIIHIFKTTFPYKIESSLHRKYSLQNIHNEWFEMSSIDVDNFLNECKKLDNVFHILNENYTI